MARLIVALFVTGILIASCSKEPDEVIEGPRPVFVQPNGTIPPGRTPPVPGFLTVDIIEDSALLSAQRLTSDEERQNTRFLSACADHNQGLDTALDLQAVNLGLNKVSRERFLTVTTPIGEAKCLYMFDIRDFSITRAEWQDIENATLLDFVSETTRNKNLQFLLQTRKPIIHHIELCAMLNCDQATEGTDLYYNLLDQAKDTQVFFADEGVNVQKSVDETDIVMTGHSESQIALGKTRLNQIVESTNGFCATTYDSSLAQLDDLFTNPFTVEVAKAGGVLRSRKVFNHVAQEHICHLANGLQFYRLNDAADIAQNVAPADVVTNPGDARIDARIFLGSCNECHFEGLIRPPAGQIRDHVLGDKEFNQLEQEAVAALYNYPLFVSRIDDLNKRMKNTLAEINITATEDPLTKHVFPKIRNEMNISQVASYLFLTPEQLSVKLEGIAVGTQLGNLLGGGKINLATLKANFKDLSIQTRAFQDEEI